MIIKEIPIWERPRERGISEGIEKLSSIELLAIILRTGTKNVSATEVAAQILNKIESINDLSQISFKELETIKGVGPTKAITIMAAIELGKRINCKMTNHISAIKPSEIFEMLKSELRPLKQEHLYALYLDAKGKLINRKLISMGGLSATIVDPKIIFRWAYKNAALGIVLVHNHPSGDVKPSQQDIKMTENIIKQSKYLDFSILDHIIIGDSFFSMRLGTDIFD